MPVPRNLVQADPSPYRSPRSRAAGTFRGMVSPIAFAVGRASPSSCCATPAPGYSLHDKATGEVSRCRGPLPRLATGLGLRALALLLSCALCCAFATTGPATAQDYPGKVIRVIMPLGPGRTRHLDLRIDLSQHQRDALARAVPGDARRRAARPAREEATAGLAEYSHVVVVFHMHKVPEASVATGARHPRERLDWPKVGIFAQPARSRPNRIGVTTVELVSVEGHASGAWARRDRRLSGARHQALHLRFCAARENPRAGLGQGADGELLVSWPSGRRGGGRAISGLLSPRRRRPSRSPARRARWRIDF